MTFSPSPPIFESLYSINATTFEIERLRAEFNDQAILKAFKTVNNDKAIKNKFNYLVRVLRKKPRPKPLNLKDNETKKILLEQEKSLLEETKKRQEVTAWLSHCCEEELNNIKNNIKNSLYSSDLFPFPNFIKDKIIKKIDDEDALQDERVLLAVRFFYNKNEELNL